ncbi:hypothetical protein ACSBR2_019088 [Camellia fascicularis]
MVELKKNATNQANKIQFEGTTNPSPFFLVNGTRMVDHFESKTPHINASSSITPNVHNFGFLIDFHEFNGGAQEERNQSGEQNSSRGHHKPFAIFLVNGTGMVDHFESKTSHINGSSSTTPNVHNFGYYGHGFFLRFQAG